MIQDERIQFLNERPRRERGYVLYWMQASQREEYNHALEYAVRQANELELPLVTVFGLTDHYPEANERHYSFMLEGLEGTATALRKRGIQLVILGMPPDRAAITMAREAALLVTDAGYLRHQRAWREQAALDAPCRTVQVESDVVVPLSVVSQKEEYAAATLRPKIHRHLDDFLIPLRRTAVKHHSLKMVFEGLDIADIPALLRSLRIDRSVAPSPFYRGGTQEAVKRLDYFLDDTLSRYGDLRNHPDLDRVSHLSPYLHFGQISPLYIALKAGKVGQGMAVTHADAFLEELIVRRELAMNFVYYNDFYDTFAALPDWARKTLEHHRADPREYTYRPGEWERGETHDPFWNAAQEEMVVSGKMHNYMRMYWGKKILEWSATPEEAFQTALTLNNRYELDGRDPNSYAGVAWCFGKHDRAWGERSVYGKIRYMNANGLRRKFDMNAYLQRVRDLTLQAEEGDGIT